MNREASGREEERGYRLQTSGKEEKDFRLQASDFRLQASGKEGKRGF
jgi:hypothetical protein